MIGVHARTLVVFDVRRNMAVREYTRNARWVHWDISNKQKVVY